MALLKITRFGEGKENKQTNSGLFFILLSDSG